MQLPKFKGSKSKQLEGAKVLSVESFHTELKKRIADYFESRQLKSTGNWKLYSKALILLASYFTVYVHLVFFTPALLWAIFECLILGVLTAAVGFNIMHDGIHGSFSSRSWVNKLAGLTLNMLGANNFMWKTKHNIIHHTYTNIDGVDDDIEARREVPLKPMKIQDHLSFWFFKLTHFLFFIIIPVSIVGFKSWLIGFLAFGLFTGFVLSIVFQLAHTVADTSFISSEKKAMPIEEEWAIHQLKTTANFATHNKFISWWLGGLNFQIEHHLFPRISHVHYPAISKIIRDTCAQFEIPYIEYPRMRYALVSHVSYLRGLSRP